MTLIPSTRPCSLDCTSLSEPIRFFLLSVLFLFVLITSLLIYEDFASVSFGLYLPFLNLCFAHVLGFSCCLLWSVPHFLQIYQGCLNCSLDYTSVCFLYMRSDLSSTVHWTVPPMFGFHHMYFDLSLTVHRTVPPWF